MNGYDIVETSYSSNAYRSPEGDARPGGPASPNSCEPDPRLAGDGGRAPL